MRKYIVYAIIANILWGTNCCISKFYVSGVGETTTLLILGIKYFVVGAVLLVFSKHKLESKQFKLPRRYFIPILLMCAFGYILSTVFNTLAFSRLDSITVGLIYNLEAFFVVILGVTLLRDKLSRIQQLTFSLYLVAIVLLFTSNEAKLTFMGCVFALVAQLFLAMERVLMKKTVSADIVEPLSLSCRTSLLAGVVIILGVILLSPTELVLSKEVYSVMCIEILSSVIATVLFMKALKHLSVDILTYTNAFSIITTLSIGYLAFGEVINIPIVAYLVVLVVINIINLKYIEKTLDT